MKSYLKESKFFLLSGLLVFVLTQIVDSPYDFLIAGFWLGFWGGVVFKFYHKDGEF